MTEVSPSFRRAALALIAEKINKHIAAQYRAPFNAPDRITGLRRFWRDGSRAVSSQTSRLWLRVSPGIQSEERMYTFAQAELLLRAFDMGHVGMLAPSLCKPDYTLDDVSRVVRVHQAHRLREIARVALATAADIHKAVGEGAVHDRMYEPEGMGSVNWSELDV